MLSTRNHSKRPRKTQNELEAAEKDWKYWQMMGENIESCQKQSQMETFDRKSLFQKKVRLIIILTSLIT